MVGAKWWLGASGHRYASIGAALGYFEASTGGAAYRGRALGRSQPGRERFGRLATIPRCRALQRLERPGAIQVDHRIELLGE